MVSNHRSRQSKLPTANPASLKWSARGGFPIALRKSTGLQIWIQTNNLTYQIGVNYPTLGKLRKTVVNKAKQNEKQMAGRSSKAISRSLEGSW